MPPTTVRPDPSRRSFGSWALPLIVVVGATLRLVQWSAAMSLWLDEFYLAESILEASWLEILSQGLRQQQVAPLGFIGLEKLAAALFGSGERALRLVPLAASIGTLVAMPLLARRILSPIGAIVAVAFVAFNPLMISLAGAVKPYAVDVFVVVLLLGVLERLRRIEHEPNWAFGVAIGTLGLFSVPSVIVAGGAIGAWCLGGARRQRGMVLAWGLTAVAAALWARVSVPPPVSDFMHEYWTGVDAFMPPLTTYPTWLFEVARNEMVPGLLLRPYVSPGYFPLAMRSLFAVAVVSTGLFGVWRLARRRDWGWAVALALPFAGAIVLSRLALYPLAPRVSVYLLPPLALLIGIAVGGRPGGAARRSATLPAAVVLAGLALVLARELPPFPIQNTRAQLSELATARNPGSPIVVHPFGETAFAYYGSRLGLTDGIEVLSTYDPRTSLIELDAFRGQREVWVVFTFPTVRGYARDPMLCYLSEIGVETERTLFPGASTHRFDLSDPARWTRARAEDFAFDVPEQTFATPACGPDREESGS